MSLSRLAGLSKPSRCNCALHQRRAEACRLSGAIISAAQRRIDEGERSPPPDAGAQGGRSRERPAQRRLACRDDEFTRVDFANVDSVRDIAHVLFDRLPRASLRTSKRRRHVKGRASRRRERLAGNALSVSRPGMAQHRDGIVARKKQFSSGANDQASSRAPELAMKALNDRLPANRRATQEPRHERRPRGRAPGDVANTRGRWASHPRRTAHARSCRILRRSEALRASPTRRSSDRPGRNCREDGRRCRRSARSRRRELPQQILRRVRQMVSARHRRAPTNPSAYAPPNTSLTTLCEVASCSSANIPVRPAREGRALRE